ncbi:phosphomannomutase/phosphoglucomutase [Ihubacter sp. rT4E-8]|uniref:phosphomannomutase/phosphoglucomutase n=1 Tax=Ihubacter sp. rT4E-8 TaxID=3242369 RepID=UPI003CF6F076
MSKYDYSKLQNGSDIRGIALEGVPGETVNLNSEAAGRLARGFLFWLMQKTGKEAPDLTISIGQDPRLSGDKIAANFMQALHPYGCQILSAGLASTPAMFMSTIFSEYTADGAVMVTASHLPWNRNGLKFFDRDGGLNKGDITDIITFAESDSILNSIRPAAPREIKTIDLLNTYSAHLRRLITDGIGCSETDSPLSGMKITVDAGNGAGGFYASKVLQPLGADISSSQFLEPDGHFPNHAPNPEDKNAMEAICTQVKTCGADLGLIFDTDVDRSSAVDEKGREISRNGIVAMAAALIADKYPGTTVVTDSITSNQLTVFLEDTLGLSHLRFKRGYKNVINKSIELCRSGIDSQLAIETSGHAAYKENYFLDDGAYLATKIVIKAAQLFREGRGISSLIADLETPAESIEIRFPILSDDFVAYGDRILKDLEILTDSGQIKGASLVKPNYEGVRINFNQPSCKGWLLLRKSLHDPIMPLNIESDIPGGVHEIRRVLKPLLAGYDKLDISKL